jgi:glycosyltransferase involved in cell wall biosynthesis
VATAVPGCQDVVVDGLSGLLCRPRDAEDLAHKLAAIARLRDDELTAMGKLGRMHVAELFDERIVIGHYLDALVRLARKPCG